MTHLVRLVKKGFGQHGPICAENAARFRFGSTAQAAQVGGLPVCGEAAVDPGLEVRPSRVWG